MSETITVADLQLALLDCVQWIRHYQTIVPECEGGTVGAMQQAACRRAIERAELLTKGPVPRIRSMPCTECGERWEIDPREPEPGDVIHVVCPKCESKPPIVPCRECGKPVTLEPGTIIPGEISLCCFQCSDNPDDEAERTQKEAYLLTHGWRRHAGDPKFWIEYDSLGPYHSLASAWIIETGHIEGAVFEESRQSPTLRQYAVDYIRAGLKQEAAQQLASDLKRAVGAQAGKLAEFVGRHNITAERLILEVDGKLYVLTFDEELINFFPASTPELAEREAEA